MRQLNLQTIIEATEDVDLSPPFEFVNDDDEVIGLVVDPKVIEGLRHSRRLEMAQQFVTIITTPRYDEDSQIAKLQAESDAMCEKMGVVVSTVTKRIPERSASKPVNGQTKPPKNENSAATTVTTVKAKARKGPVKRKAAAKEPEQPVRRKVIRRG